MGRKIRVGVHHTQPGMKRSRRLAVPFVYSRRTSFSPAMPRLSYILALCLLLVAACREADPPPAPPPSPAAAAPARPPIPADSLPVAYRAWVAPILQAFAASRALMGRYEATVTAYREDRADAEATRAALRTLATEARDLADVVARQPAPEGFPPDLAERLVAIRATLQDALAQRALALEKAEGFLITPRPTAQAEAQQAIRTSNQLMQQGANGLAGVERALGLVDSLRRAP